MNVELEEIGNRLKGVASVLSMMSECPKGDITWSEWALQLLHNELAGCIGELEEIASKE